MSRINIKIEELEIVGYATVLTESMLPSIVPPVFRLKTEVQKTFVPPYSFKTELLSCPTEVSQLELEKLRDSHEITLFDVVFAAHANFELWIDQSRQWHYEPRTDVELELCEIADKAIEDATKFLRVRDFERAERLTRVALSANDKKVEPLAIRAAIHRMRGNVAGERFMSELAKSMFCEQPFALLVSQYCNL